MSSQVLNQLQAAFPQRALLGVITPHKCEECAAVRSALPSPFIPLSVNSDVRPHMNRQREFLKRGSLLIGLVGVPAFYIALKVAESLITDWSSWTLGWRGWISFVGFVLAVFWYAVFVTLAETENWFGSARRFVTGVVLGAASGGIAWSNGAVIEIVGIAGAIGTIAGFFVDKWIDSI